MTLTFHLTSLATLTVAITGLPYSGVTGPSHSRHHWPLSQSSSLAPLTVVITGLFDSRHHWPLSQSWPLASLTVVATGLSHSRGHWPLSQSSSLASLTVVATGLSHSCHHWPLSQSSSLASLTVVNTVVKRANALFSECSVALFVQCITQNIINKLDKGQNVDEK